jgi:hypothetical protein
MKFISIIFVTAMVAVTAAKDIKRPSEDGACTSCEHQGAVECLKCYSIVLISMVLTTRFFLQAA